MCVYQLLKTHSWRMLEWMLVQIEPSPYEAKKLQAAGITNPVLASYCVWRRTMLLLAFPSLACWGLSSLGPLGVTSQLFTPYNAAGRTLLFLPIFAGLMLVLGSGCALWYWTDPVLSNRLVMAGWILSMALPFVPALFPMKYIINDDTKLELAKDPASYQLSTASLAVVYMIQLTPTYVSIPLGMVRASLRIRGLLPDNALAGWILMVTLPLKALVLILGLILASQMVGDVLLILSMALYVIGPGVYLYNRKLYTDPVKEDWHDVVQARQGIVRWTGLLGLILLVAWLVTADWYGRPLLGPRNDGDGVAENDPLWTYGKLVRFVFEFMGRTFCATLCFADLFLRASIAHWHAEAINRQRRARQRSVMALSLRASVANIITYSDHRDAKYADMQRELQSQQRNTGSSNVTSEAVFDPDEDKDERTNNDDNDSDPTHQHNATKTAGGKSKEMDKTWPSPHSLDSPSKEEDVHA